MMKLPTLFLRRAAFGILHNRPLPVTTTAIKGFSTAILEDYERKLKEQHEKATHAIDRSRGGLDMLQTSKEMKDLHELYHKIDVMETDLSVMKAKLREDAKIFAVDAADGQSDGYFKEEMEEIKHIIDYAAKLEDNYTIKAKHMKEQKVKEYHARDPEHDW
jgi:hypothetical protein